MNEKSHYATLISSLNKEYNGTKVGKSLTPNDIYILDIIYKLLQGYCLTLSDVELKKLLNLYNSILYNSKIICNNSYQEIYQMSKKDKFIQAEKSDFNIIPSQPTLCNIYYWQENGINIDIEDIFNNYNTSYFLNKSFDTSSNFENIGKTINYEYIGRIFFYATNSDNKKYEFFDGLNNDVTDIFDNVYISDENSTIFVSKDFYSISNVFFKIKKTKNINNINNTNNPLIA